MDNFKAIYQILKILERAMDYTEFDLEQISHKTLSISEARWTAIIEMLVCEGYITGISIKRGVSSEALVSIGNVRITLKGLEYLSENSFMKKASNIAKGISNLIP